MASTTQAASMEGSAQPSFASSDTLPVTKQESPVEKLELSKGAPIVNSLSDQQPGAPHDPDDRESRYLTGRKFLALFWWEIRSGLASHSPATKIAAWIALLTRTLPSTGKLATVFVGMLLR